jgi:hypothetical protein
VYLHETIETAGIERTEVDSLRRRVHDIVTAPVEKSLEEHPPEKI